MAFNDVLTGVAAGYKAENPDPRLRWRKIARPSQLLPPLSDPWRVTYFQGGRGSGKTRAGAQGLADWCLSDPEGEGEYGIIAPTYADAWTKCVEGKAGILRAMGTSMAEIKDHRSKTVKHAWRTYGQVILHNGIVIYIDSAAEGGLRIQGRNLKGAWCDEIGLWEKWETAWDESLKYAVRDGISRIIATGTPKASRPARKLVRRMIRNDPGEGGVVVRRLRTIDNAKNLSDAFLRAVVGAAQGTRLERQELEGELLDDVANALWTRDQLDSIRIDYIPPILTNITIGVDPSDGGETSDEQAYTVAGLGPLEDGHIYVTENWGGQEAPVPFAMRVIRKSLALAKAYPGTAPMIIIEKNHGGAWLTATFQQVMRQMRVAVPYKMIHASHGKRTRAEPVSALYEQHGGLVRHCHIASTRDGHRVPDANMPELEDQMATFTGAQGERSPDRLDSLVWAMSPFLRRAFGPPGRANPRRWAAAEELETVGEPAYSKMRRRLSQAHGGVYAGRQWTIDEFAPADDDKQPALTGPRGNVKGWR
ncbi:MAG TPA: terminase family protein [Streptosporangiaceae bacterium]|nr:terminase family protein [Streptosporangiaceae bacterium]